MAKKIILLMLVIPIVVMISLYATTQTVSLAIDIGVTGVSVTSDKFLSFNIDNYEEQKIEYAVFPTNAKNKEVTFETSSVDDGDLCELEITKDGVIKPKSTGKARVNVVTNDGGFKDGVIVEVFSSQVSSINITNRDELNNLYVGDSKKINVKLEPENADSTILNYSSSNPNILSVDNFGNLKALSKGVATITIKSEKYHVETSIDIIVENTDILNITNLNEAQGTKDGSIYISIDTVESYGLSNIEINFYDELYNDAANDFTYELEKIDTGYLLNYHLTREIMGDLKYIIEVVLNLDIAGTKIASCDVLFKTDFDFSLDTSNLSLIEGQESNFEIKVNPSDLVLEYEFIYDKSNFNAEINDNSLTIKALKVGIFDLQIKATYGDKVKDIMLKIVVLPRNINILENANVYGISNQLTFGRLNNKLNLNISDDIYSILSDYIYLEASDVHVNITNNHKEYNVNLTGPTSEYIEFKVIFKYEDITKVYDTIKVRCFYDGENVSNYNELKAALSNEKVVVLKANITDFPLSPELNKDYTELKTTSDWGYYKNLGKEQPSVKVMLEIKNDLYGNGYEINGHNSIYEDKISANNILSDDAIFRGPLDFVGVGYGEASDSGMAAVKAQDNIFVALYDDVTIMDVTIKNCNDVGSEDEEDLGLSLLQYVGTTVETLGDNINILYSRLSNGRTVLRTFGDDIDPNKITHVNVSNSILSNAREFIVRIGSNKYKTGNLDASDKEMDINSLYLDINDKILFPFNGTNNLSVQNYYDSLSQEAKTTYDDKYINTYLTLDNVALEKSGIFSIALDSHFAGPALAGGFLEDVLIGWKDLAKTSYGAKLILKNTVNIYDWKPLANVKSDTLIEVTGNNETLNGFRFDVAKMVESIANNPAFKNILYNDANYKDYVHGGIAYFGGGLNYNVVDRSEYKGYTLHGYQIGLDDVSTGNGTFDQVLPLAAGNTDFYFLLCDTTNITFTPVIQDKLYSDGGAYDFIYSVGGKRI